MKKNKHLIMLAFSMFLYGTIGIFRKNTIISSSLLAFVRGIIGALILYIWMKMKKHTFHSYEKSTILKLILSGALMGFNWVLLFEAYNYTSVAVATLCYYMEPIFLILASSIFFHEKLTTKKIGCIISAFIGMIFISGMIESGLPSLNETKGILFGLAAAILYTIVVMMNKQIKNVDTIEKTIYQLLSASMALIPYLFITSNTLLFEVNGNSILMILILGIVHTGIAYALYFGSLPYVKTQTLALFSYIDPVVAILLSAFLLQEGITIFGIIGAILILGSTIVSEW